MTNEQITEAAEKSKEPTPSAKENFNKTQVALMEAIMYLLGTDTKDIALGYLGVFETIFEEKLKSIRGEIEYLPSIFPDNKIHKEALEIIDKHLKK